MASTASLSKVHEADSLWSLTSSLIGSLDVLPQMVPGQDFPGLRIPDDGEFVAGDAVELVEGEIVSDPQEGARPWHLAWSPSMRALKAVCQLTREQEESGAQ